MRALGIVCLLPFLFTSSAFAAQRDENPASELQVHRWMKDLAGEDWVLQSVALEELGKRKAQQAAPRIREVLEKGKTPWIRGRAMFALGRISGREIIPLARKAARDEDRPTQRGLQRELQPAREIGRVESHKNSLFWTDGHMSLTRVCLTGPFSRFKFLDLGF